MIKLLSGFKPKIQIDMETRNTILHMANCSPDLEFCIYCFVKVEKNVFTLTGHPRCPEQEVEPAHFDVLRECKADFHNRLYDEGHYDDPELHLIAWGHSHVDMGVSPSAEDADALQDHWKESKGTDYLVRFIFNKKGDFHFDLLDVKTGVVYWDLGYTIVYPEATDEIKTELSFAKEKVVVRPLWRGYGGYDYTRTPYYSRTPSLTSPLTYGDIEKQVTRVAKNKKELCHVLQWVCVSAVYESMNPHLKMFDEVDQTVLDEVGDEWLTNLRLLAGENNAEPDVLLNYIRQKTHAKISKKAWKALKEVRNAV